MAIGCEGLIYYLYTILCIKKRKSNLNCIIFFQKALINIPIPEKLITPPIIINRQLPFSPAAKIAPPIIIKIIPSAIIIFNFLLLHLVMYQNQQK